MLHRRSGWSGGWDAAGNSMIACWLLSLLKRFGHGKSLTDASIAPVSVSREAWPASKSSPPLAIPVRAILVAHARRCRMSRHLKTLAGVGDPGAADFQDREILGHVVSGQDVLAIGGEQHSLRQSADLDVLGLGHLLAVDLQDREAAVLLVEKRLLVVGAAQDGGDREIALR